MGQERETTVSWYTKSCGREAANRQLLFLSPAAVRETSCTMHSVKSGSSCTWYDAERPSSLWHVFIKTWGVFFILKSANIWHFSEKDLNFVKLKLCSSIWTLFFVWEVLWDFKFHLSSPQLNLLAMSLQYNQQLIKSQTLVSEKPRPVLMVGRIKQGSMDLQSHCYHIQVI